MEKLLRVEDTNKSDLIKEFEQILDEKLKEFSQQKQKKKITLLSRKETAAFFGVSVVTIDDWTRKNLIVAYRQGNRKFFKLKQLEQSLTQINHKQNGE